ncbi:metal ABC transporter substrate-binding protein [Peptoniphilus porci]|uniref:Zinc ABC transporter substrate-binding protein n=1 Tax=Peptoniphilus porci TaxID=2652280 RepID=A0A1U7M051_9FIRM|nr:metal ABC transporter substrate-binding protein [Peptoniphilus porci]OLR65045.1 zinc ABC transporter substrate-binding protein [Peptoniphilus porci]
MSKIIKIILVILLASSLISCKKEKNTIDKPVVYTSFYPVYSLAKSVVGDTVDLRMFMPKNQDPHLWEPTPKKIKELSKADLLIINGANLEHWSDAISKTLPNLDILNLASGVNLISYKGAAAIGDFQYMVMGNFGKETYSFDFGHTHEDNMRIAFLYCDREYSNKELIKIGRKLMEDTGEDIPQKHLINVVDKKVYKLEMGHEHGEIYYKLPKKGKWILFSDRVSTDLLSYKMLDLDGNDLNLKVLRDTSTTNEDKITYDPHSWMSIRNAKRYVNDIEYKMSQLYPENKNIYRKNASKTLRELTALDYKYRDLFKNTKRKEFIVSHFAFAYLAKDFDLIQYPLQGLTSTDSPSIKKLIKVIEDSKARHINTIFYEYGMPKNGADIIAEEIGADLKGLISMEYINKDIENQVGKDYIDMIEYNLKTIYDSLR